MENNKNQEPTDDSKPVSETVAVPASNSLPPNQNDIPKKKSFLFPVILIMIIVLGLIAGSICLRSKIL
jgi:hypothetical protein